MFIKKEIPFFMVYHEYLNYKVESVYYPGCDKEGSLCGKEGTLHFSQSFKLVHTVVHLKQVLLRVEFDKNAFIISLHCFTTDDVHVHLTSSTCCTSSHHGESAKWNASDLRYKDKCSIREILHHHTKWINFKVQ